MTNRTQKMSNSTIPYSSTLSLTSLPSEILQNIFKFFGNSDDDRSLHHLFKCLAVSKSFLESCAPVLWRHIDLPIGPESSTNRLSLIHQTLTCRSYRLPYHLYIRSLRVRGFANVKTIQWQIEMIDRFLYKLKNIVTLVFIPSIGHRGMDVRGPPVELDPGLPYSCRLLIGMANLQNLKKVVLNLAIDDRLMNSFLHELEQKNVKLSLQDVTVSGSLWKPEIGKTMNRFLKLCPLIHHFRLISPKFCNAEGTVRSGNSQYYSFNLQDLNSLSSIPIRSLSLSRLTITSVPNISSQPIVTSQTIRSLHLSGLFGITEPQLSYLLRSLPNLSRLVISDYGFNHHLDSSPLCIDFGDIPHLVKTLNNLYTLELIRVRAKNITTLAKLLNNSNSRLINLSITGSFISDLDFNPSLNLDSEDNSDSEADSNTDSDSTELSLFLAYLTGHPTLQNIRFDVTPSLSQNPVTTSFFKNTLNLQHVRLRPLIPPSSSSSSSSSSSPKPKDKVNYTPLITKLLKSHSLKSITLIPQPPPDHHSNPTDPQISQYSKYSEYFPSLISSLRNLKTSAMGKSESPILYTPYYYISSTPESTETVLTQLDLHSIVKIIT